MIHIQGEKRQRRSILLPFQATGTGPAAAACKRPSAELLGAGRAIRPREPKDKRRDWSDVHSASKHKHRLFGTKGNPVSSSWEK